MWNSWEMTASSLLDDVFPCSEERLERTFRGASDHPDSFVGGSGCERQRCRDGKEGIGLVRTPQTGGMEELSARCGTRCSKWKDLITVPARKDQGATTLVLDVAEALERDSLPVVWAWTTHFKFPVKILFVLCGYFEHQRR